VQHNPSSASQTDHHVLRLTSLEHFMTGEVIPLQLCTWEAEGQERFYQALQTAEISLYGRHCKYVVHSLTANISASIDPLWQLRIKFPFKGVMGRRMLFLTGQGFFLCVVCLVTST